MAEALFTRFYLYRIDEDLEGGNLHEYIENKLNTLNVEEAIEILTEHQINLGEWKKIGANISLNLDIKAILELIFRYKIDIKLFVEIYNIKLKKKGNECAKVEVSEISKILENDIDSYWVRELKNLHSDFYIKLEKLVGNLCEELIKLGVTDIPTMDSLIYKVWDKNFIKESISSGVDEIIIQRKKFEECNVRIENYKRVLHNGGKVSIENDFLSTTFVTHIFKHTTLPGIIKLDYDEGIDDDDEFILEKAYFEMVDETKKVKGLLRNSSLLNFNNQEYDYMKYYLPDDYLGALQYDSFIDSIHDSKYQTTCFNLYIQDFSACSKLEKKDVIELLEFLKSELILKKEGKKSNYDNFGSKTFIFSDYDIQANWKSYISFFEDVLEFIDWDRFCLLIHTQY